MKKETTIIAERLPSLRTGDMKDWDTISNYRVLGKNRSLSSLQLSYHLTRDGLFLYYNYKGVRKEQQIDICFEPSNLGVGEVWFMKCPETQTKCRKLVFWQGQFVHQSVIKNLHYIIQTESDTERKSKKWIRRYHEYQNLLEKQRAPYYKSTYSGRYTKTDAKVFHAKLRYAIALQNTKEINAWFKQ